MTTDLSWLAQLPGRCPSCYLHESHGHRSEIDGTPTGCNDSGPLGLELARERRDQGMKRTVEAHPDDAALVDEAIRQAVRRGRPFSANNLRYLTSQVSEPHVIGARIRAWASSKRIKAVGVEPSELASTNAHKINVYVGADAA